MNYREHSIGKNSFAFVLHSNGRFNSPMKFEVKENCDMINLFDESEEKLINFCSILSLYKQNNKEKSCCSKTSVTSCCNFYGLQYPLCGQCSFVPRKFMVVEMIQKMN